MKNMVKILILSSLFLIPLSADVKHFKNVKLAFDSFIEALKTENSAVLEDLISSEYKNILHVKKVEDNDIEYFLQKYQESHKFPSFDAKTVYLEVGTVGWTFPIPLSYDSKGWYFDLDTGIDNIITREIGRNELAIIEALQSKISLEVLQSSDLGEIYFLSVHGEFLVAIPKAYKKTAVMSFVLNQEGQVFEADLAEEEFVYDARFQAVQKKYLLGTK